MTRTPYRVHLTFRFPAWDEKDGLTITLRGSSKADASKWARKTFRDAGHENFTLKATEITEAEYEREQERRY